MATEGEEGQGYQFACSLKELEQLGRKRITVEERVVVVFHVKGQVYALDHFCYRKLNNEVCIFMFMSYHSIKIFFMVLTDAGGPLELGDIEVHRQISIMAPFVFNKLYLFTVGLPRSSVRGVSMAQAHHHSGHRGEPLHGI